MKALVFFIFYFLAAALLAAIISFPLFELIGNDSFKFERFVTRSALLFLVLGLIPCFKFFNISLNSIGYNTCFKEALQRISKSFIVGLLILGAVILTLIALEVRPISPTGFLTGSLLIKALLAGLVVALIEETLFRGLFFKLTASWHSGITAVIISSFFYAILHFIKPIQHIDQNTLSLFSGFDVIINAFYALTSMQFDDFIALFAVGTLLGLVRLKTKSLIYCIGLHASWVFLIKITKELTYNNKLSDWSFLTGEYDGIIGLLSFCWLTILSVLFVFWAIKPKSLLARQTT
jgi:membrane protease YdiL (CAAX protease family)